MPFNEATIKAHGDACTYGAEMISEMAHAVAARSNREELGHLLEAQRAATQVLTSLDAALKANRGAAGSAAVMQIAARMKAAAR